MRKGLFDFNGDGRLDARERYVEWMTFNQVMRDCEENDEAEEWEDVELFDLDDEY